jgi:hypothetical protein
MYKLLKGNQPAQKAPPEAPSTIANMGQGAKGGGWTAAKIDSLDEDELDSVPAEVYEKYLSGELK